MSASRSTPRAGTFHFPHQFQEFPAAAREIEDVFSLAEKWAVKTLPRANFFLRAAKPPLKLKVIERRGSGRRSLAFSCSDRAALCNHFPGLGLRRHPLSQNTQLLKEPQRLRSVALLPVRYSFERPPLVFCFLFQFLRYAVELPGQILVAACDGFERRGKDCEIPIRRLQ